MERLCDVMFELSNEYRLRILRELEREAAIVTGLSNRLGLTNQEVSRHLSRLGDVGLTTKVPDGQYSLTSYGRLTLKQIEGLEFTSRHKEYFIDHTAEDLPASLVYRMGELEGSARVDDVMVVFHNVERMIREAEEYIWRLTDRYLMMAIPELEAATDGGVEFRLMQSKDFEFPPDWPGPGRILAKARVEGVYKLRESNVRGSSLLCLRRRSQPSPFRQRRGDSTTSASPQRPRVRTGGALTSSSIIGIGRRYPTSCENERMAVGVRALKSQFRSFAIG